MVFLHDDTSTLHHWQMRYHDGRRSDRPFWTIRSSLFFLEKMQSRYVPAKRHIQSDMEGVHPGTMPVLASVGQQTFLHGFLLAVWSLLPVTHQWENGRSLQPLVPGTCATSKVPPTNNPFPLFFILFLLPNSYFDWWTKDANIDDNNCSSKSKTIILIYK